jgi:hypothetical protein
MFVSESTCFIVEVYNGTSATGKPFTIIQFSDNKTRVNGKLFVRGNAPLPKEGEDVKIHCKIDERGATYSGFSK